VARADFLSLHTEFPARARQLGGTWDAGRLIWPFDRRDEDRVRALCAEVYLPAPQRNSIGG